MTRGRVGPVPIEAKLDRLDGRTVRARVLTDSEQFLRLLERVDVDAGDTVAVTVSSRAEPPGTRAAPVAAAAPTNRRRPTVALASVRSRVCSRVIGEYVAEIAVAPTGSTLERLIMVSNCQV